MIKSRDHHKTRQCRRATVTIHPLRQTIAVNVTPTKAGGGAACVSQSWEGADPLSDSTDPLASMHFPSTDPLASMHFPSTDPLASMHFPSTDRCHGALHGQKEADRDGGTTVADGGWPAKALEVLSQFTSRERVNLSTSVPNAPITPTVARTVSEKTRDRLQLLEKQDEGFAEKTTSVTQGEFVAHIEELSRELQKAWGLDQRVRALKMTIQCCKLLSDVTSVKFYPSKFVHVSGILDLFGQLVYKRLYSKAGYTNEEIDHSRVPDVAQETCRNWFYKIASIRELLPRFYIEVSLLKCYAFIGPNLVQEALARLSITCRGLGDPLVACFARSYLCRKGYEVAPQLQKCVRSCFTDFVTTYSQVKTEHLQNFIKSQNIVMSQYMRLYSPALEWTLQYLARQCNQSVLQEILDQSLSFSNSAILANSVMKSFSVEIVVKHASEFMELIKETSDSNFPKYLLLENLGRCLVECAPAANLREPILRSAQVLLGDMENDEQFFQCMIVWTEYVIIYFTDVELSHVLDSINSRTQRYTSTPGICWTYLLEILRKLLDTPSFTNLFKMEQFTTFVDIFNEESVKIKVCKTVLERYVEQQNEQLSDARVINGLKNLCKSLHDSVTALTLADEVRHICRLISAFVDSVSFQKDFEAHLKFFVDARAAFSSIDAILQKLIMSVNKLSMDTHRIMKGRHSKKTFSFAKACAAYCFITIPSITSITMQMQLYLLAGQAALLNRCLPQADAFYEAALSLIASLPASLEMDGKPKSTKSFLMQFVQNFLSSLILVPDDPQKGVLFLLHGLLNSLNARYQWNPFPDEFIFLLTDVLATLCTMRQPEFPYAVIGVESNDRLYGSDEKYLAQVDDTLAQVLSLIKERIRALRLPESVEKQSQAAFHLLNRMLAHFDFSQASCIQLAASLYNLCLKNGHPDESHLRRLHAVLSLKSRSGSDDSEHYANLLKTLQK